MKRATLPLRTLESLTGATRVTLWRWYRDGLLHARHLGPGRGRGVRLTDLEARDAVELATLRRAGIPCDALRSVSRSLRRHGMNHGFLAVSPDGTCEIVSSPQDAAPLAVLVDVSRLRRDAAAMVAEVSRHR